MRAMWLVLLCAAMAQASEPPAPWVAYPDGSIHSRLYYTPILGTMYDYVLREHSVITDSIHWDEVTVLREGDQHCWHCAWVYGDSVRVGRDLRCDVNHMGFHCDQDDVIRTAICRDCLRAVRQREHWYQRRPPPARSEFDSLKALIEEK